AAGMHARRPGDRAAAITDAADLRRTCTLAGPAIEPRRDEQSGRTFAGPPAARGDRGADRREAQSRDRPGARSPARRRRVAIAARVDERPSRASDRAPRPARGGGSRPWARPAARSIRGDGGADEMTTPRRAGPKTAARRQPVRR